MAISLPQRVPQNAPGDFYVEAGMCTRCCLPHGEAPELLNDRTAPFDECYFRRQPQTPDEVERAVAAMCVSEMCALRYAGNDPSVIAKLRARDLGWLCDQTPEGQAWLNRPPPAVAAAAVLGADDASLERFAMVMRHYAIEGLFILGLFPICLAVFWSAKHFAWSDATISAAIIVWMICWLSIVLVRGERIINRIVTLVTRRKKTM
jgi:hypothetical protein